MRREICSMCTVILMLLGMSHLAMADLVVDPGTGISVPEGYAVEVYASEIPYTTSGSYSYGPSGLAFDSGANLYVGMGGSPGSLAWRQLVRIPPGGGSWAYFGSRIEDPDPVDVDSYDNVWVGSRRGTVKVAPDGATRTVLYTGQNTDGVAVNSSGEIFVGDSPGNVHKFSPEGEYLGVFVKLGGRIHGMDFNSSDNLFAWERTGKTIFQITPEGEVSPFVAYNRGLVADIAFEPRTDNLFLADPDNGELITVTPQGQFQTFATGLLAPLGVVFDEDGNLFVTECFRGKVLKIIPPPAQTIQYAHVNVYNILYGEGPADELPREYGFEVFIETEENLGAVSTDDIVVTVDGTALPVTIIDTAEWQESFFYIRARGRFGEHPTTEPIRGDYQVTVRESPPFYIGKLGDIPKDAPDLLSPQHGQRIADPTPTFEWEAFQSDYLGERVSPWAYEINLTFPDGSGLTAFPIPGEQTSLDYATAEWNMEPPEELPPGTYSLTIHSNHVVVDTPPNGGFGFEHHRTIEFGVVPYLTVKMDIKPQSCPNPLNTKSKGVLPVAILGTRDLDVTTVDPSTVQLEGVAPLRWDIEDVSTPVLGEGEYDCTTEGADGFDDLTLKFDTQAIVAALGGVAEGDEVVLTLTGALLDGTPIEGKDGIVVRSKGKIAKRALPGTYALSQNAPNPFNPTTEIAYALAEDVPVRLVVYNLLGQPISTLVDEPQTAGYHTVTWDASGMPGGIYLCRLEAGSFVETRRMILMK